MGLVFFALITVLLYLIYSCVARRIIHNNDVFAPLPYTVLSSSLLLYIIMELLSVKQWITSGNLTIVWASILVLCGLLLLFLIKKTKYSINIKENLRIVKKKWCIIALFLLFSAFMIWFALRTPLYNWDSMCYHLTRVTMWAQNQSINHYATMDLRQLSYPVLSEMSLLNVYVLTGKEDILFNLPQCIAFLLDTVLVYSIAKKLGCKDYWAVIAAVLFMATPIAFSEALNTQNDLFTAVHLLSTIYIIIDCISISTKARLNCLFIFRLVFLGIGIAMSYHSKYYTLIPIAFFLIWLMSSYLIHNRNWKVITISVLIVVSVALILYLPEGIRMGGLEGEVAASQFVEMKPNIIMQTFAKNFFNNFPSHYIMRSNSMVFGLVSCISKMLNLDLGDYPLQDPFVYDHDLTNGFLVCSLFVIAIPFVIVRAIKQKKFPSGYIIVSFVSFIVFLAVLRYTPYRTRYELVFFAFLIPALCMVFQNANIRDCLKHGLIGIILFISICEIISLPIYHWQFTKYTGERREQGYFIKRGAVEQDEYELYNHIANVCKENECTKLGINIPGDTYAYPLIEMSKDTVSEVRYVNVDNISKKYEDDSFVPDTIVYIGVSSTPDCFDDGTIVLYGEKYSIIESSNNTVQPYFIARKM